MKTDACGQEIIAAQSSSYPSSVLQGKIYSESEPGVKILSDAYGESMTYYSLNCLLVFL